MNKMRLLPENQIFIRFYIEACNERPGPSPRLSTRATQLRNNIAAVASCRHIVSDLTCPGIERKAPRRQSCFTTTGRFFALLKLAINRFLSEKRKRRCRSIAHGWMGNNFESSTSPLLSGRYYSSHEVPVTASKLCRNYVQNFEQQTSSKND